MSDAGGEAWFVREAIAGDTLTRLIVILLAEEIRPSGLPIHDIRTLDLAFGGMQAHSAAQRREARVRSVDTGSPRPPAPRATPTRHL